MVSKRYAGNIIALLLAHLNSAEAGFSTGLLNFLKLCTNNILSKIYIQKAGLLVGCGEKREIWRDFQRQIHEKKPADFAGILREFSGQMSLKK